MGNRIQLWIAAALLTACSASTDRNVVSGPNSLRTRITFEPIDRDQARTYLEAEKQSYKAHTQPMVDRRDALLRGREERYAEIRQEFPECDRQKHCIANVSRGEVKKFERYSDLLKEINRYDAEILDIDSAMRDWDNRLEIRSRAIVNRFLVHEILQIPGADPHVQGVLAYSLESFETRRQLVTNLFRFTGEDLEPRYLGDYDFRMYGRPVDEAAVIATFEVFLATPRNDFQQPTHFTATMLVNSQQIDLHYYDSNFLRAWGAKFTEPYQPTLKRAAFCGLYSITGDSLAPRFTGMQARHCAETRMLLRGGDAVKLAGRLSADQWLLPLAYFPISADH